MQTLSLNKSSLQHIGLQYIRLQRIGLSKSDDSLPQWFKDSIVCWCDTKRQGCTNENMAENPILRDLSGNGRDVNCHNFAWTKDSGIDDNNELRFDGVTTYSDTIIPPLYQDFTVIYKRTFYKDFGKKTTAGLFIGNGDNTHWRDTPFFLSHNTTDNGFSVLGKFALNVVGHIIPAPLGTAIEWYTPLRCHTESQDIYLNEVGPYNHKVSTSLLIGHNRYSDAQFAPFALSSFLLFNRTLTDEEIEYVKNNLIY